MIFRELPVPGAFLLEEEPHGDERGNFARTFCAETFRARGLEPVVSQCSVSRNLLRGTLRGMHFQRDPHAEVKLVSCMRGAVYDVLLDLRPGPSFGRWTAVEIRGDDGRHIYVPRGVAHGFQTLEDDTALLYQISTPFAPEAARGVRFDDPAFAIAWPLENPILSPRDRSYPGFAEESAA